MLSTLMHGSRRIEEQEKNKPEGMKEQFQQLGCCKYVHVLFSPNVSRSNELNYVGAKVVARIDSYVAEKRKSPEEAGVNYYRQFVENSLHRNISFSERVRIFHTVNANWIFAIYAGMNTIISRC